MLATLTTLFVLSNSSCKRDNFTENVNLSSKNKKLGLSQGAEFLVNLSTFSETVDSLRSLEYKTIWRMEKADSTQSILIDSLLANSNSTTDTSVRNQNQAFLYGFSSVASYVSFKAKFNSLVANIATEVKNNPTVSITSDDINAAVNTVSPNFPIKSLLPPVIPPVTPPNNPTPPAAVSICFKQFSECRDRSFEHFKVDMTGCVLVTIFAGGVAGGDAAALGFLTCTYVALGNYNLDNKACKSDYLACKK